MRRLCRTEAASRRLHDVFLAGLNLEWPEFRMVILREWRLDQEAAVEAFTLPKILFRNLMANRASHAIFRAGIFPGIAVKGKVREDLPQLSFFLSFISRHWHVAVRAAIFNFGLRFGMVDIFAPHTGLPIGIAC